MQLPNGKIVAIDLETSGLRPYHGDKPFYVGYATDKGEKGCMPISSASIKWLHRLCADKSRTLVFHNAKFDLTMLTHVGIDTFAIKAKFDCTLTLSKVLFSTSQNHDLRTLTIKLLKRDPKDKDDIQLWIKSKKRSFLKEYGREPTFKDAPEALVKSRVVWDAESTVMLHQVLRPKVKKTCESLYQTEHDLILVCIDMEKTGILVDMTKAKQLKDQATKDLANLQQVIDKLVGCPLEITRKKKNKTVVEVIETLNCNSSAIHLPAAFQKMGIQLKYKTQPKKNKKGTGKSGGGRWSFDEYAMVRYVSKPLAMIIKTSSEEGWTFNHYFKDVIDTARKYKLQKRELLPPLVLKYRELSKMISTYYEHLLNDPVNIYTTPAGRQYGTLHCKFNPSEAMTGRFSVSEPSLQNWPRLLGPRQCIVPRPGRINLHNDYEQVEMKMFVHFAKDPIMAKAVSDDIHLQVAAEIYQLAKKDISSEKRKRAKATNFGIIYGAGAKTIAETLTKRGLPTSESESRIFVASYHQRFPSVRRTTQSLSNDLRRVGYIINPFGRRYHIPVKFGYKALNYMCQGTSADLMKWAMVQIWEWLRVSKLKSKIIMTIHDEIVLEVVRAEFRLILDKVKELMEDKKSFFVPITIDQKMVNKHWGKKVKIE